MPVYHLVLLPFSGILCPLHVFVLYDGAFFFIIVAPLVLLCSMLSFFFSVFSVLLLCLLRRSHLFSFSCVTVKLRGDLERDVFYINASFFFV